jgi:hypothetical protein
MSGRGQLAVEDGAPRQGVIGSALTALTCLSFLGLLGGCLLAGTVLGALRMIWIVAYLIGAADRPA